MPWHMNYRHDSHPAPPPLKEIDVPRSPTWSPLCQFLAHCTALEKLTINSAYLIGMDMLAILQSCSQITNLVLDQHDRMNYAQQGYMYYTPDFKYNLYPLFKQQLFSLATRTVTDLKVPLLPSLKSFSVRAFYASDVLTLGVLA
ncbi:hypothetical protein BJ165DRAFT_1529674 [Panaeolus papilionaceus]|nr:hypothetical protein BJ165DRAFT_1529674 [Panaeolus papilionaceus]